MTVSLVEFFGGLALMLAGSHFLPRGIGRLGARLRLGGGHLGLVTALTANSCESTAGITGLIAGLQEQGRGAILLVDRQNGKAISITLWEDEQALRASDEAANALGAEAANRIGASETPSVERYEVAIFES